MLSLFSPNFQFFVKFQENKVETSIFEKSCAKFPINNWGSKLNTREKAKGRINCTKYMTIIKMHE